MLCPQISFIHKTPKQGKQKEMKLYYSCITVIAVVSQHPGTYQVLALHEGNVCP